MDNPIVFAQHEQTLLLTGAAGAIEVVTAPATAAPQPIIGVICHPHPLQGGTLRNKVVTTVHRAFQQLGVATVRFNFRGVGQSEGSFAQGVGEMHDLLTILTAIKTQYPQHGLWLAGFSFGSYVAAAAAQQCTVDRLISIAPPVNHYDFTAFDTLTCPWWVVQGGLDEVVPLAAVEAWRAHKCIPVHWLYFPEAGHFFHGQLVALREALCQALV